MNNEMVLEEFRSAGALLNGHFILSSGLHSDTYLQCARVMMDAQRGARLCAALSDKVRLLLDTAPDLVISPAMGGVVVGYEMGRQLGLPSIFLERVSSHFALRRGFEIPKAARCLIVEDVVTTGLSLIECMAAINAAGGESVGVACLIDRSGGEIDEGIPIIPLARLLIASYTEEALPLWLANLPAVKPGSRSLPSVGDIFSV
ncbi:MAG: orotate phosphoribosyltransferase [Alphaproteobacteria bacterium]|nr:orotate phosphoribosyltransferase [Alphaproteobacteria bacterium]